MGLEQAVDKGLRHAAGGGREAPHGDELALVMEAVGAHGLHQALLFKPGGVVVGQKA